jgi:urea transporter
MGFLSIKGLSEKNIRDGLFAKNLSLHDFQYTISLRCIYNPRFQNCIIQFLSRVLYLQNRTRSQMFFLRLNLPTFFNPKRTICLHILCQREKREIPNLFK